MSIVNVKIVLVKKQKQTRESPTQGWGSTFIYNSNGPFHTRDGLFVWEEFFSSDTPPKYHDRDCVGRRRTDTRQGNVYRSVREKQGIVVYRQRVLQTVASPRVVSLVFRGHDLLKISNISPSKKPDFLHGKNSFTERAAEKEPRSRSTPKRRLA